MGSSSGMSEPRAVYMLMVTSLGIRATSNFTIHHMVGNDKSQALRLLCAVLCRDLGPSDLDTPTHCIDSN